MPLVSIIMSVYNGEVFLKSAIESILKQSFQNFEFIIINDKSTDLSAEIIRSYKDERIVYLENEQNLGLAKSLNRGIKISKGIYIARMDDDDISYNNRLQKEVDFLEKNLDVGLVGTYARLIGDSSGYRKHSSENNLLKIKTLFSCQFIHPTVMIRKSVLDNNNLQYNEEFKTAQDYELWSRLIFVTNLATIPEILLDYRVHDKQLSATKRIEQLDNTEKIYKFFLLKLNIKVSNKNIDLHKSLAKFNFNNNFSLEEIGSYIIRLIEGNKMNLFNSNSFNVFFAEYFYNLCKSSKHSGLQKIKLFKFFGFHKYFYPKFAFIKLILSKYV